MTDRESSPKRPARDPNGERPILEAVKVSKRYEDGTLALDTLDLVVRTAEIYCLLGSNGAGKTTAINLFLNFIEPTSGHLTVDGHDVVREPLEAKKKLAYLSENVTLYRNFTARQNLEFFGKLGGKSAVPQEDLHRILREAGLPETAFEQRVRNFSKGMRQKLGIAICMLKDSPALILDEPMSGLDPKAAADFMNILRRLRAGGKAILMSTHDIFRAKELADRVGILNAGRKVTERTRQELVHEDLEKMYLYYMRFGSESWDNDRTS